MLFGRDPVTNLKIAPKCTKKTPYILNAALHCFLLSISDSLFTCSVPLNLLENVTSQFPNNAPSFWSV